MTELLTHVQVILSWIIKNLQLNITGQMCFGLLFVNIFDLSSETFFKHQYRSDSPQLI